jgi:hypothetical protein
VSRRTPDRVAACHQPVAIVLNRTYADVRLTPNNGAIGATNAPYMMPSLADIMSATQWRHLKLAYTNPQIE